MEYIVLAISVATLAFAILVFISTKNAKTQNMQIQQRAELQAGEMINLQKSVEGASQSVSVLTNNLSALTQAISLQSTETAREIGQIRGVVESLKGQQAIQIERIQKATEDKLASFEMLQRSSISQLSGNMKELVLQTSQSIAKMENGISQSVNILKADVSQNLKNMNTENQKELERMRVVVDEKLTTTLETRLSTSFSVINKSLEQVYKGLGDVQSLTKGVGDLKNVLQNVKTRGTWAEVQLDNLLSQMLTPNQYKKQALVDTQSSERVDFGIILPGKEQEMMIPIDSKFPIEDYHRLVKASEEGDAVAVNLASKKLEDAIKIQAVSISTKYIRPPKTTDFAVMYLPLEGLYAEVLRKSDLVEKLQREKRVVIAGPSTLGAILSSLQMGFRTLEIEKRSGEIYDLLAIFKKEFLKFSEILEKTQKKITEAGNQIELARTRTRTIGRKLKDVTSENAESLQEETPFAEIGE